MSLILVFSFNGCGSKKRTTSTPDVSSETISLMEEEIETETEIILEVSKDATFKDECGNEIKVEEGEKLVVVEKTTDEEGKSVYVLENGAVVKEETVSEVATEKITVKPVETTSKENVLKNEDDTTSKKETITKKQTVTTAKQTTTQKETTTEKQTTTKKETITQPQTATKKETTTVPQTTQPQTTVPPTTQPQTTKPPVTQPATTKPQETTTKPQETTTKPVETKPVVDVSYYGHRTELDMKAKQLILDERKKAGANANPTWNEHLYKVAQARAKEIVSNFSHDSIGGLRDGYNVSEALTYFSISSYPEAADKAISNWVNSSDHYRILLKGDQYAVASYQNGKYIYWVCITASEEQYIAENYAKTLASEWENRYEEKYEKYYNSFIERHGNRKIW